MIDMKSGSGGFENALTILENSRSLELKRELKMALKDIQAGQDAQAHKRLAALLDRLDAPSDLWLHRKWDRRLDQQAAALSFADQDRTVLKRKLRRAFLDRFDRAERGTDPFPYFTAPQTLPDEMYLALLLAAPHVSAFRAHTNADYLQQGQFQRYFTAITPEALSASHPRSQSLWMAVKEVFHDPDIIARMCECLDIVVPPRWRVVTRLQLDRCGALIAPHLDGEHGGLFTFQMYFPLNKDNFDTGTSLFRKQGSAFETVHKFTYAPNFAYGFKISDSSWHGALEGLDPLAEGRMSLVVRLFKD